MSKAFDQDVTTKKPGGKRLVWVDSPLQDEHPVAKMDTREAIHELGRRVKQHSRNLGYNEFARFMEGRSAPQSLDELRRDADAFLRDRCTNTPIFDKADTYLTESGTSEGRRSYRSRTGSGSSSGRR